MTVQNINELEELVSGKVKSLCLRRNHKFTREVLLEQLNNIIVLLYPEGWMKGTFVDAGSEYLIYDINISGVKTLDPTNSSIRLLDFGDNFKLLHV
jgi:hypothetical protein